MDVVPGLDGDVAGVLVEGGLAELLPPAPVADGPGLPDHVGGDLDPGHGLEELIHPAGVGPVRRDDLDPPGIDLGGVGGGDLGGGRGSGGGGCGPVGGGGPVPGFGDGGQAHVALVVRVGFVSPAWHGVGFFALGMGCIYICMYVCMYVCICFLPRDAGGMR